MIQYIYFVKCPDCEDEPFDFFKDAKDHAISCLSKKPIITQVEVNRNDFGECTDSSDLGTIWSWEDMVGSTEDEPAVSVFTKDDLATLPMDNDPEFATLDNSLDDVPDNFEKPIIEDIGREAEMKQLAKEMFDLGVECTSYEEFAGFMEENNDTPTEELYAIYKDAVAAAYASSSKGKAIPEGMTIEQLVEEMEENEDTVECTWCEDLFDKSECRYEVDLGWLCGRCEAAIKSRGEPLTFRENNYWDFLDEEVGATEEAPLKEASSDPIEEIEFEYDDLKVTLQGPKRDVDDWDEEEKVVDFLYKKDKEDVAMDIWDWFITEEDVKDVPGGLEALEDDTEWAKFLAANWDNLLEKHYKELLDHYRSEATEEYENSHYLDETVKVTECDKTDSFLEALEEREAYDKRLTYCPECDTTKFDPETGICINCGFN
jgi:hypothetical protein